MFLSSQDLSVRNGLEMDMLASQSPTLVTGEICRVSGKTENIQTERENSFKNKQLGENKKEEVLLSTKSSES